MESELVRVTKLKNSDNWGIWKFQIRVLLNSHGVLKVQLGTDKAPEAPAEGATEASRTAYTKSLAAWEKIDAMAQKIIVRTVADQSTLHIINCRTAAEMWSKLISIYEQRRTCTCYNRASTMQLRKAQTT